MLSMSLFSHLFSQVVQLPLGDAILPGDVDAPGHQLPLQLNLGVVDASERDEGVVDGDDARVELDGRRRLSAVGERHELARRRRNFGADFQLLLEAHLLRRPMDLRTSTQTKMVFLICLS